MIGGLANDEHMAEEEREGLADFRQHAPPGLREALGDRFARFFEEHPTTDGVNITDRDPQRYVAVIEREIDAATADGSLGIGSLRDMARGAADPELGDLARAASVAAIAENRAVFHGWASAGITGLTGCADRPATPLGDDCPAYPTLVAQAVDRMRQRGVGGPYALAISPERYTRIVETTEQGGYLLVDHLMRVLSGQVVWAPGLDGALVLSQRGGDFVIAVGQDWSVGYRAHDAASVSLYLEESMTFRVLEPDAVAVLS